MENCRFCEILSNKPGKVILEGKHCFVILSEPKLMDGHLLVIPKRHVEKISELNEDERAELFKITVEMQEKVLEKMAPGCDICEHYRPFIPDNKLKVTHLHMHIRPRFLDDELYMKVQKFENEVFRDIEESETNKYKEILL